MSNFQQLPSQHSTVLHSPMVKTLGNRFLFVGIVSALCALFLILSLTITDLVAATGTTLIKGEVVQVHLKFGFDRYCLKETLGDAAASTCVKWSEIESSVPDETWSDLTVTRGLTIVVTVFASLAMVASAMAWRKAHSLTGQSPNLGQLKTEMYCVVICAVGAGCLVVGAANGLSNLKEEFKFADVTVASQKYGPMGDLLFTAAVFLGVAAIVAAWTYRMWRRAAPTATPANGPHMAGQQPMLLPAGQAARPQGQYGAV